MQILPIPTDNLYKFCALSGLILIILCFYGYYKLDYDIRRDLDEFEIRSAILEIQTEYLMKEAKELNIQVTAKTELKTDGAVTPNELLELSTKNLEIQKKTIEYKILQAEQEVRLKSIKTMNQDLALLYRAGIIGILIGILLSVFGFTNWYLRIQRPLDNERRKQSTT